MKKLFSFAIYAIAVLAMALAMESCKKEKIETMNHGENTVISNHYDDNYRDLGEPTNDSLPPIINTSTPSFPCEVLFVINKEYELAQSSNSDKNEYLGIPIADYPKGKYLELRLMDLYPDKTYEV